MHLLTKEQGEAAVKASLVALKHLNRVGLYSPYVDSFVSLLSTYNLDDEAISKFIDPQWTINLQNLKNKKLRDLNPESIYHETDVFTSIEVSTIYIYNKQYNEAQAILASSTLNSQTCQISEISAQIGLLQGNLNLTLNQDKRIEAFISTSLSNELYLKRLTESEIISYWRVKFLILFAEFSKNNFKQVSASIFELIRLSPIETSTGKEISALDILNSSNFNKFINRDQIVIISVLSILLTYPANELNNVLSEPEFISLVGNQLNFFKPFFTSTNSARFKELFENLNSLDKFMIYDPFLSKVWNNVKLKFRQMSFKIYLSLVIKVSTDHLSSKLNIPKLELITQLKDYIESEKLEFQYNELNDVFEKKIIEKNQIFIEKLQYLSEESDKIENQLREKLDNLISQTNENEPTTTTIL